MLNQAKQLSEELMSKAKSEKAYHEQLIEKLRSESKSFKDSLLSLYESQMDRLGDMVDLKPQVDEDQAHIDSVESEMNQIISNIDEINKLQSQTVDAPTEETAAQEPPAENTKGSVFDTTRAKLSADGIEVTMKISIPQYKQINSKCICVIDGAQHEIYNVAHVTTKDGFKETELTLKTPTYDREVYDDETGTQ